MGSGYGTFGKAVASNNRDLRFESSHWQNLYVQCTILKRKKEAESGKNYERERENEKH